MFRFRPSLRLRLALFLVALAAIATTAAIAGHRIFDRLRISGPIYEEIARKSELLDDFNPALQVIDEAFTAIDELVDVASRGDSATATKRVASVEAFRRTYDSRRRFWLEHDAGDPALARLMANAAAPASEFFRVYDAKLLPALGRGDYRTARALREGPLDSLFRLHRDRVGLVRARARADVDARERAAALTVARWSFWLGLGSVLAIITVFAIAWMVLSRSVLRPLRAATRYLTAIGEGDYDLSIDASRHDEIGDMLAALDRMRRALKITTSDLRTAQEQIRASEERFALAMRGTDEGLWDLDLSTGAAYLSPRWLAILGYAEDEVEPSAAGVQDLVHPDDRPLVTAANDEYFSGRRSHAQVEVRMRHKDGRYLPILSRAAAARRADGTPARLVGTILDLTALHRVRDALIQAQQKYHDIVEHSPQGIYQTTPAGHPLMVNRACATMLGFDQPASLLESSTGSNALYVDPGRRLELLEQLRKNGTVVAFQARMRRRDGSIIWTSNTARVVRDERGQVQYIEGFLEDITARQLQEETIVHLAMHDPLTDLPNRRAMDEALLRAIARTQRGERSAFLLIDLDNFKAINDTVGHPAGDRFLKHIGPIFRRALRPADTIARFGGDEFAILLEGVTVRRARAVAERLRSALGEFRFQEGSYTFAPSASIGAALIEDSNQDPTHIVSLADSALHAAKEQGKNRCVVYQSITERETKFTEASQWATRIKDAMREDRLVLHFQPIVRFSDRSVAFCEALVRMREADGSLTGASSFIPAAERFGLASAVDEWVIREVLRQLAKAPSRRVCVNLSGASLGDELLLQRIERDLAAAGAAANSLMFEITETAVVQDLARAREWMGRLSKLGCRFALDDFGMGFSSFAYLRSLPVHEVKIDGTFIQTIVTDAASRAVVGAITELAHALGKGVIAEWVEDPVTADRLASLGVDYGQGFLWPTSGDLDTAVSAPVDEAPRPSEPAMAAAVA